LVTAEFVVGLNVHLAAGVRVVASLFLQFLHVWVLVNPWLRIVYRVVVYLNTTILVIAAVGIDLHLVCQLLSPIIHQVSDHGGVV
jgi:hypothetical protein